MKIKIGKDELEYTRPTLKSWLVLQDLRLKIDKAVNTRIDVAKHCVSYVSTALSIPEEQLEDLPWYEIGANLLLIQSVNVPKFDFPLLNAQVQDKKEMWDYEGRTWYVWSHILAKEYGWTLEYVANLDVDDAIALAQEIAVEEQLQREWEWMTCEIAYHAKDGFKELPRPRWMYYTTELPPSAKKTKIRKDFLPVGIKYQAPEHEGSIGTV